MLLPMLDAEVEARASAMKREAPSWPCRAGCDDCCRNLHRSPVLTRQEFERLQQAVKQLGDETRQAVQARLDELSDQDGRVVCPMLDTTEGRCLTYDARPVACRTYGYYRSHSHDAWCDKVQEHVQRTAPACPAGNHDAVERALQSMSTRKALHEWWREAER